MGNIDSIRVLRDQAVSPNRLKIEGSYTAPRSFGVYRLTGRGNLGKKYRFGNHPVRMYELIRDFGECEIEALFLKRSEAELLARLLNSN